MRGEYQPHGVIEVITGGMFSGKSEELLRRLRRVKRARLRLAVFKPTADNRDSDTDIVSHIKNSTTATAVPAAKDVERLALQVDAEVVGIDEAQFFDQEIIGVCERLAAGGVRVIVAGLDLDYQGQPFGPMPSLMSVAEDVQKLSAICEDCGAPACRSERIAPLEGGDTDKIALGAADKYLAKCRKHFKVWNPPI